MTEFAYKYPGMVDALFLVGYSTMSLKETQRWQLSRMEGGDKLLQDCYNAMERGDNEWFMKNMGVTLEWYVMVYNTEKNDDLFLALDLPTYIFHGALDGLCDVNNIIKLEDTFTKLGKTNLRVYIFEHHGHGLEMMDGSSNSDLSEGIKSLVDTIIDC
jgi:pimeloyl-ACP methyl ester carboxylesterase